MGEGITLKTVLTIKGLCGINYREHAKGFKSKCGEDAFYRLFYIDKGTLTVSGGKKTFALSGGECLISAPGTAYVLCADGENPGGIITLAFDCAASFSSVLNKTIPLTKDEKRILGSIIKEAKDAFSDFSSDRLKRRKGAKSDSEQMLSLLLQMLLLSVRRNSLGGENKGSLLQGGSDMDIINSVVSYLEENISEKLRFKDVTSFAKISATALKTLFVKRVGCGVMEYFSNLKLERAKRLIRENEYNFTEISRLLGYDSLHYFSRRFKQKTGMSPTEYANSARMFTED